MAKNPAFQLYTGDWLKDPRLSMCSPSTRGIWIDLICAMHEADRSGQIVGNRDQLARLCRCTAVEISDAIGELANTGAADVTERNGIVTLQNRRMKREYKAREDGNKRVNKHRKLDLEQSGAGIQVDRNADVTGLKRRSNIPSSSSSSTSVTSLSHEGANARGIPPPDLETVKAYGQIHNISEAECETWYLMRAKDDFKTPFGGRDGVVMRPIVNWQADLAHQHNRGNLKPKPETPNQPRKTHESPSKGTTKFERALGAAFGDR